MKYFATVGERHYECTVESGREGTFVVVDGQRYAVDLEHIAASDAYSLLVDGRSFEFTVRNGGEALRLTGAAGVFDVQVEDERTHAARKAVAGPEGAAGPRLVKSAMPGIVLEVLVKPGDAIQKGAPLLVLEAMKMQNEIRAPGEGTVVAVHVAEGTTVEKGARLVEIE